jgi:5-methyltetrahydropteroyltriglutamate--homocysteine methyltransferase
MKQSIDRIITTHVGSLPRPPDLLAMIQAKEEGTTFDARTFAARVRAAVAEAVKQQAESGIDVSSPMERWAGSASSPMSTSASPGSSPAKTPAAPVTGQARANTWLFPTTTNGRARRRARRVGPAGPISYRGQPSLQSDTDNLKAALAGIPHEEAFMPAVSPTNLANWNTNELLQHR